jgi:hypothetical protein
VPEQLLENDDRDRVLTRILKRITKIAGADGTELRDRMRSVQLKVLEIGRAGRARGRQSQQRLKSPYSRLLHATSRVVGQAKRVGEEIIADVKRSKIALDQMALEGLREELETIVPLVNQVTKQTRARISRGEQWPENGGPDARDASVWSSGGTGSTVAAIKVRPACSAGSRRDCRQNLVNIGRALQQKPAASSRHQHCSRNPPAAPGGYCCVGAIDRPPHVPHFCAGK